MKYVIDEDSDQLIRVDNDRSEHVWITEWARWNPLDEQEAQDGLFWGTGNFREVNPDEAEELYPDAFGGAPRPEQLNRPPKDHSIRFEQQPLTTDETAQLIVYFGAGKEFKAYLVEQRVPPIKQGAAQQLWLSMWNERRRNPGMGFDTPSEWA